MKKILFRPVILGAVILTNSVHAENAPTPVTLSGDKISLLDAVQITIENSPEIIQQRLALDVAKATEQMNASAFDVNASAMLYAGRTLEPVVTWERVLPDDEMHTDDLILRGGLSKMFRSGVIGDFSVKVARAEITNTPDFSDDFPFATTTSNKASVDFSLIVPLLKGRGAVSAAAEETSARLQREATFADLQQAVSATVLKTVEAFWDYKGAVEILVTQKLSEQRVQSWQDSLSFSLSGSERLSGYLADKKRIVAEAEESVNSTKSALAIAMGIPADQVDKLGAPDIEFDPGDMGVADLTPLQIEWKQLALQNRLDLQAAKLRQQASAALLEKARRDLNPQLDLTLSAGYLGLVEGESGSDYFNSLNKNVPGPNTSAMLNFSYPLGNNLARGQVALHNALNQQSLIARNELQRGITVKIGVLAGTLQSGLESVAKTAETADFYERSMKAMLDADELNSSDLFELEDKLMSAATKEIEAIRGLAKTIAEIRFDTGTLIVPGEEVSRVQLTDLTQLPM